MRCKPLQTKLPLQRHCKQAWPHFTPGVDKVDGAREKQVVTSSTCEPSRAFYSVTACFHTDRFPKNREGRFFSSQHRHCSGVQVISVHYDCDKDSIIYLSDPTGPSCHTGSDTCWYQAVAIEDNQVMLSGGEKLPDSVPRTSLQQLQYTIEQRKLQAAAAKEGVRQTTLSESSCLWCLCAMASTREAIN